MQTRENALNDWLKARLKDTPFRITPLAGDASFRRYFRLALPTTTQIIMDAPPEKEALEPFIRIQRSLAATGILTPVVHQADLTQGFAILDDLGDHLFLYQLTDQNRDDYYTKAIDVLIQMQHCTTDVLPSFDKAHMLKEMHLFHEWFLKAYLQLSLSTAEEQVIQDMFHMIADRIVAQPQVFIHRDYHSRNIMITNHQLGIIDFQDAMHGPLTYDLVSLLKDCYIQLPDNAYQRYIDRFYQHQPLAQRWSTQQFKEEIDYCGLQRHLKVLGIFCRLYLRDKKPNYLNDLPLTLHHTITALKRYPTLAPLRQLIEQRVLPAFMETSQA